MSKFQTNKTIVFGHNYVLIHKNLIIKRLVTGYFNNERGSDATALVMFYILRCSNFDEVFDRCVRRFDSNSISLKSISEDLFEAERTFSSGMYTLNEWELIDGPFKRNDDIEDSMYRVRPSNSILTDIEKDFQDACPQKQETDFFRDNDFRANLFHKMSEDDLDCNEAENNKFDSLQKNNWKKIITDRKKRLLEQKKNTKEWKKFLKNGKWQYLHEKYPGVKTKHVLISDQGYVCGENINWENGIEIAPVTQGKEYVMVHKDFFKNLLSYDLSSNRKNNEFINELKDYFYKANNTLEVMAIFNIATEMEYADVYYDGQGHMYNNVTSDLLDNCYDEVKSMKNLEGHVDAVINAAINATINANITVDAEKIAKYLKWVSKTAFGDDELKKVVAGINSFSKAKYVSDFKKINKDKLSQILINFLKFSRIRLSKEESFYIFYSLLNLDSYNYKKPFLKIKGIYEEKIQKKLERGREGLIKKKILQVKKDCSGVATYKFADMDEWEGIWDGFFRIKNNDPISYSEKDKHKKRYTLNKDAEEIEEMYNLYINLRNHEICKFFSPMDLVSHEFELLPVECEYLLNRYEIYLLYKEYEQNHKQHTKTQDNQLEEQFCEWIIQTREDLLSGVSKGNEVYYISNALRIMKKIYG